MMRNRPEKDTKNPPGQIVNPKKLGDKTLADYIKRIQERENDTRTKHR